MRKIAIALVFLFFLIPNPSLADFQVPEQRWTIGYENGLSLRRFLGDKWEVFLGGGPDDYKTGRYGNNERDRSDYLVPTAYDYSENSKSESGFVYVGFGRRLIRDGRFWMTATLDLSYGWDNFQYLYEQNYSNSGEYSKDERTGHNMTTRVSLGIRPAYDITSRIVLLVDFGIYYKNFTETVDSNYQNTNPSNWTVDTSRYSRNTDSVGVFGFNSITSIGLIFRF